MIFFIHLFFKYILCVNPWDQNQIWNHPNPQDSHILGREADK